MASTIRNHWSNKSTYFSSYQSDGHLPEVGVDITLLGYLSHCPIGNS
jgi:hypothetical protein